MGSKLSCVQSVLIGIIRLPISMLCSRQCGLRCDQPHIAVRESSEASSALKVAKWLGALRAMKLGAYLQKTKSHFKAKASWWCAFSKATDHSAHQSGFTALTAVILSHCEPLSVRKVLMSVWDANSFGWAARLPSCLCGACITPSASQTQRPPL